MKAGGCLLTVSYQNNKGCTSTTENVAMPKKLVLSNFFRSKDKYGKLIGYRDK